MDIYIAWAAIYHLFQDIANCIDIAQQLINIKYGSTDAVFVSFCEGCLVIVAYNSLSGKLHLFTKCRADNFWGYSLIGEDHENF